MTQKPPDQPDKGNPIARAMAARTCSEVTGENWIYRVRTLTPLEAVHLEGAMSMIAAAIAPEPDSGEGEAAGDAVAELDAAAIAARLDSGTLSTLMDQLQKITVATVREARLPGTGSTWYPLRVVARFEQQQPDAGKVFIGALPPTDVALIAFSAMSAFRRAKQLARPFQSGSATQPGG